MAPESAVRGAVVSNETSLCRGTCLLESREPERALADGVTTGTKVERPIARSNDGPAEHGR